jgi:hypothetical protein
MVLHALIHVIHILILRRRDRIPRRACGATRSPIGPQPDRSAGNGFWPPAMKLQELTEIRAMHITVARHPLHEISEAVSDVLPRPELTVHSK